MRTASPLARPSWPPAHREDVTGPDRTVPDHATEGFRMWDVAYLLITIIFFAAMLWFVRACESLGRGSAYDDASGSRGTSNGRRHDGRN